ncbi:uncharacterized protein LAESUDRAFT_465722 [Laetiporus sulphureus 93-53]|uniref:Uncharacterized protein n=1 Tax=Laetiporus sulphureus 93-53 TaxID=1314785 RepID=A0A165G7B7_9APHY|nr:uncharacterized protein LAESUDRAFT_465722 [Laetiporus sulphureus 93-53]KZT09929.1 hypothetical protein LAESUDRAFT_465722 [Laetiporus sulphureus 93-53]
MSSHASASTAGQPSGRTMAVPPARSYSRSDPIDLTLDDDDGASSRQVIDPISSPQPRHGNLPADSPPKTPVCIGQLSTTTLVLYPVPYLLRQGHVAADSDWALVRLCYEHAAGQETIHVQKSPRRAPPIDIVPGENFGVAELKVAMSFGPMLGKGLIWLDAEVQRGQPHVTVSSSLGRAAFDSASANAGIHLKENIPVVANFLHQSGLFLDHPTLPFVVQWVMSEYYYNPHNPPPGGHARALTGVRRLG